MPDKPPFFGSWPRIYTFVLVFLVFVIAGLAWFAQAFRL